MNTDELIDTGLTIDLQSVKIGMIREKKNYEIPRERITSEKYFRQAIYIFNEEGKYVDSGFVQINDYTNMCKMVKVLDKEKKFLHLFERWEHYGPKIYKSDKFSITDLVTGNTIGTLKSDYVDEFARNNKTYFIGDLDKDEYSEMLFECLNEYSNVNMPQIPLAQLKNLGDKTCGCNLVEELKINELLKNGDIYKEQEQLLIKSLKCSCKSIFQNQELGEEEKIKRAELKLQAQVEISNVFLRLKLKKD